MNMSKDLAETLTALAALVATLPELNISQLGWFVALGLLFRQQDRRTGKDG